jgi:hypothetical protein
MDQRVVDFVDTIRTALLRRLNLFADAGAKYGS